MKAIIFDCFGVLYVDSGRLFYETYIPNYAEVKDTLRDLDKQVDYGLITQEALCEQVAGLSGLDLTFVRNNIQGTHVLNDRLLGFAQSLRSDYKIGMLSNIGPDSMEQFFTASERRTYFDGVVLSGEVGMVKPDPAVYQIMAQRLGVQTGDCIMIDDSESNCAGADAAGMRAVVYESNKQVQHDIELLLRPS